MRKTNMQRLAETVKAAPHIYGTIKGGLLVEKEWVEAAQKVAAAYLRKTAEPRPAVIAVTGAIIPFGHSPYVGVARAWDCHKCGVQKTSHGLPENWKAVEQEKTIDETYCAACASLYGMNPMGRD